MNIQHKNLAKETWFSLSITEQLGNIGSEYERALSWKRKGNAEFFDKAFLGALELVDISLQDKKWKGSRLKKLCRVRGALCYELTSENVSLTAENLQKYFLYFALLARAGK